LILLIDHLDSFSHILAGSFATTGNRPTVVRCDDPRLESLAADSAVSLVVFSPGPGAPSDYPRSRALIRALLGHVPIFGVCLGHQLLATALGCTVTRCSLPRHGFGSLIHHPGTGLFHGVPNPCIAGRYHSLCVDPASAPPGVDLIATSDDGCTMALTAFAGGALGVQFHPESFLSIGGTRILQNSLTLAKEWKITHSRTV
jgi:anthranilate synthase/aminodeoxychorismate synthase-like glutamine amidotransferase